MASQKAHFSSPPDPHYYNARVWAVVRQIPLGQVFTYGQVAQCIPVPMGVTEEHYRAFGARWVGSAMARCPQDVPWQRVLASGGKISISGEGRIRQRQLLEAEGIRFNDQGKVDLNQYGWEGPTQKK